MMLVQRVKFLASDFEESVFLGRDGDAVFTQRGYSDYERQPSGSGVLDAVDKAAAKICHGRSLSGLRLEIEVCSGMPSSSEIASRVSTATNHIFSAGVISEV